MLKSTVIFSLSRSIDAVSGRGWNAVKVSQETVSFWLFIVVILTS